MLRKLLHMIGLCHLEITQIHITNRMQVVYETTCKICGKTDCRFD